MKYILIILSVVLLSFRMQADDTSKLYIIALKSHLAAISNTGNEKDKKASSAATVFVINEDIVELPTKVNNHPIQLIGDSASSFLKSETAIHAIKFNPIRVDKGRIIVPLSDYIITKGNNGANFSYAGGKEYIFSYTSTTKKYSLIQIRTISY